MLIKIAAFADKHDMFPKGGLILAAVSGGADSMCLLSALTELSARNGFSVAAAHYNHRLRGAEADSDEVFVTGFCREKNIPLLTGSGDVHEFARAHRLGVEDAARRLRYDFLEAAAEKIGAARIATAHTADDNAETILLNLTRGAGLTGLSGIPPTRGKIIRPMLCASRDEVMQYLELHNIQHVEDSTNALDVYRRNLLRHRVIPVLKELNPRFAENLAATSALLRDDDDFLYSLAADFVAAHTEESGADIPALLRLPSPVASRVVRQLGGRGLDAGHVASILALCRSDDVSGEVALPSGKAFREYDQIIFSPADMPADFAPVTLPVGGRATLPALGLSVSCVKTDHQEKINKSFTTFLFKSDNICGKIVIRPRETGDQIDLFGRNGTKSLKKLFIEKRVPLRKRGLIPIVADEKGVLAVFGIGIDRRAACEPGDNILQIVFEETAYEK